MPAKSGKVPRHAPTLTVLAGVNGAGKSSIGGEALRASGAEYFNPDCDRSMHRGARAIPQMFRTRQIVAEKAPVAGRKKSESGS